MSDDLPIACSLTATELPARLRAMADLGRDALLGSTLDGGHAELRFAPGAAIRARLDVIVAAESRCCAFLTMTVAETSDATVLTIEAPEGAEPVLAELVQAF